MRSEIGEVRESFGKNQVGSSTMAHKRNPITFENLEGMYTRNVGEYMKILMTSTSDHQRDLTGSCVQRDYPIIVVNLCQQLETLLRKKDEKTFIQRMTIDEEACKRNLEENGDVISAELLYILLQMSGFPGDAHELVNHTLMDVAKKENCNLYEAAERIAEDDEPLRRVLNNFPKTGDTLVFKNPDTYIGRAEKKTHEIVDAATEYAEALMLYPS